MKQILLSLILFPFLTSAAIAQPWWKPKPYICHWEKVKLCYFYFFFCETKYKRVCYKPTGDKWQSSKYYDSMAIVPTPPEKW
jgi:hypothetical protein